MTSETVSEKQKADVVSLISSLEQSLIYFVNAVAKERQDLVANEQPTAADIIKARGFALAHAGHHSAAILDLRSLVSQSEYSTPHNINKLAQVLIRTGEQQGYAEALELVDTVLSNMELDEGEAWFAYHNKSAALIGLGRLDEAAKAASEALSYRSDQRTVSLKLLAEHGDDNLRMFEEKGITSASIVGLSASAGEATLEQLVSSKAPLAMVMANESI